MSAELFGPSDVPRTVALSDLRGVDLTAEEGFLLSRIDGRVNVGAILTLVAWDRDKTFSLLESLLRKHVVNFDRKEIQERAFQAHDGAKKLGPSAANGAASAAASKAATFDKEAIEKVPDLDPDRCVEVLEWELRIAEAVSPYEVFGLPEGADHKSVKRNYRQVALSFHPDKFFRKEIGGYRARIENAWKKVQDAYDLLADPARRAAYDLATEGRVIARAPVVETPKEETGPGRAPRDMAQPLMIQPLDTFERQSGEEIPLVQGQRFESKPTMDSALTRRLKADVKERIEKAQRHYQQAIADLADGRFAAADSNVKLAMQYDPANPEFSAWYDAVRQKLEAGIVKSSLAKAETALSNGEPKQALGFYEHALGLFPDNLEVNFGYGTLLLERFNNAKTAKECLQKVVNRRPKDVAALVALAKSLRLVGMIKNAQRILDQAKAIAPKDARVVEEAKELKRST